MGHNVGICRYRAHKRGIKNGDTGLCGHRYEILGWKVEKTVLKNKAVKLFGVVLVRWVENSILVSASLSMVVGLDYVKLVTPVLCFRFKLDSVRPSVQRPHSPCMYSDVLPLSASVFTWRNEGLCSACGICVESDDSQSSCSLGKVPSSASLG